MPLQHGDSAIWEPEKKTPYFGALMHLSAPWQVLHDGAFYGISGGMKGQLESIFLKKAKVQKGLEDRRLSSATIHRPFKISNTILRWAAYGVLLEGALKLLGVGGYVPWGSSSNFSKEREKWVEEHHYEPDHWLKGNEAQMNKWAAGGAVAGVTFLLIAEARGRVSAIKRFLNIIGGLSMGTGIGVSNGSKHYEKQYRAP